LKTFHKIWPYRLNSHLNLQLFGKNCKKNPPAEAGGCGCIIEIIHVELVSKASIGLKVKAATRFQPEEYIEYFEAWNQVPNAEIGAKG